MFLSLPLAVLVSLLATLPVACQEPADLVVTGGRVVTVDSEEPEVRALAARGESIVAVGSEAEISTLIGPDTTVIDLDGRLVVPGFIDGHGHFISLGNSLLSLDLRPARTWSGVVAIVKGAVAKAAPGELISGRGWHQEKWDHPPQSVFEGLPYHHSLSAISPDNPVILSHASGHATFANARAMAMSGIDADTADPRGGEVVRDAEGEAIGVFRETASRLLAPARRNSKSSDLRRVAELAAKECLSKGVTSFQDAGSPLSTVEVFRTLADEGALGVRLWVMLNDSNRRLEAALPTLDVRGIGSRHLTVGGIKRVIDGALGSHGAWLLEPYSDKPDSTGLNTTPIATIQETARLAIAHRLQLCVHAIGDRANREILDIYEAALGSVPDGNERRWRVEHAQHLHPDEVPRFAELGVIASMQGIHCTSDGSWVPTRLGAERSASGAYLWRELIDSGVVVSNGTDCPVEDVDPILCFHATVTRLLADGTLFFPERRMTRLEALRSYTINAAYAVFEEELKGSLTVGKLCDLVIISKDILACPAEEILEA
ncbi:MAG TPA: amidohydrolase, partial [Planctomycetes bacterium]|nr:amidohydrolase [Planctomycetota bacterium]